MDPAGETHAVRLDHLSESSSDRRRRSTGDDFDQFVSAQTQLRLRLGYALTGNPHDAWDLVQEALARTGERWHREISHPAAYTRTVMVHLNIDRIRRLRRELPVLAPHDTARLPMVSPAADGGMDADLLEALAALPPRQRTAIALRYVEDLDVTSIVERMRCSEGTVKSQLSRATARLKAHLASIPGAPAARSLDQHEQETS